MTSLVLNNRACSFHKHYFEMLTMLLINGLAIEIYFGPDKVTFK